MTDALQGLELLEILKKGKPNGTTVYFFNGTGDPDAGSPVSINDAPTVIATFPNWKLLNKIF